MAKSFTLDLYRPVGGGRLDSQIDNPNNYLTVVGAGFGTKPQAHVPIIERFDSYSVGDVLINSTWKEYNGKGGALVQDQYARIAGGKYAYNNWARDQFATSYTHYPKSKKVYLSYWTRSINCESDDYGVLKYCRLTSSVDSESGTPSPASSSGGGGVYNGVGCMALSAGSPNSLPTTAPFPSFTYPNPSNLSDNLGLVYGEINTSQAIRNNEWCRVEYFIDLGTYNTSNGGYICNVEGLSTLSNLNKQMQWTGRDYNMDTFMLGLDIANPRKWFKVNGAVAPDTDYTITVNGVPYTTNSGSSPVKTEVQIMEALYALIGAVLPTTPSSNGVFLNTAHTQMYIGDPNAGVPHSFNSNFIYDAYGLAVTDVYIDYDTYSRFYLADSSNYATAKKEPQEYRDWSDGNVILKIFTGNLTGTLHLFFVDENNTPTLKGTVVPREGGGWMLQEV